MWRKVRQRGQTGETSAGRQGKKSTEKPRSAGCTVHAPKQIWEYRQKIHRSWSYAQSVATVLAAATCGQEGRMLPRVTHS